MRIISVEGVDYSGKSTLIKKLKAAFEEEDYTVVVQPFPSNDGHGKLAREGLAKGDPSYKVSHHLELNFKEKSISLNEAYGEDDNVVVLLDRYVATTRAHQDHIIDISDVDFMIPDITVLLTLDHKTMLRRHKERGDDWDKTETDKHRNRGNWEKLNRRYEIACEELADEHDIELIHYEGDEDKDDLVDEVLDTFNEMFD